MLRDVVVRLVADVGVAVGERQPGRLEVLEQCTRARCLADSFHRDRMFSASPTVMPPDDDGAMPYTSSPR